MHRDAIAFGLEKMAGQENARRDPHSAMERRPVLRALDRKIQFGPRICFSNRFAHLFAVEAQLRDREHAIGIDPGIRTSDGILDFLAPRFRKMRDLVYPEIRVARRITETEARDNVENADRKRKRLNSSH